MSSWLNVSRTTTTENDGAVRGRRDFVNEYLILYRLLSKFYTTRTHDSGSGIDTYG